MEYSFVIISGRKMYQKIIHDDEKKIHLIIKQDREYTLYYGDDKALKIKNALSSMWIIENFKKPLKAISSYKIKELKKICIKLGLSIEKKKKKELYQMISENL